MCFHSRVNSRLKYNSYWLHSLTKLRMIISEMKRLKGIETWSLEKMTEMARLGINPQI